MEMDTALLPKRRGTKKTEEEVSHFFPVNSHFKQIASSKEV